MHAHPTPRPPRSCLALLALAAAFLLPLCALPAGEAAALGSVAGRVVNAATGAYLAGAEVTVEGGGSVLTDREGSFRL
jgi:hypothetical protein